MTTIEKIKEDLNIVQSKLEKLWKNIDKISEKEWNDSIWRLKAYEKTKWHRVRCRKLYSKYEYLFNLLSKELWK